ncbi:RidA family protein [Niastella caeni]|uniref:RidA family protein n=1 Tax=Niastella caeni TaxID=2569763 RepID=A0A4V4H1M7_9BACT|nr:RidA family protein [Niastella caeni]THU41136.1 RidA family protein [Niastella caeni]
MTNQRRNALKKLFASVAGTVGLGLFAKAETAAPTSPKSTEKEVFNVVDDQDVPLFSGATKFNGMVFIAGKGAHFEGDIKAHTDHVLKELEKELLKAGSSMEKVLKVNVYLDDIKDYKAMNEVYKGRFGNKPPVRTTVAVAKGGVPGDSLVEMDCIAYV